MLVRLAGEGRSVVRLKGGDPFVFGRGSEEAVHLVENCIPFEVVPGVTAAIACAAYSGIPLTHRGLAKSVRVITGHRRDNRLSTSIGRVWRWRDDAGRLYGPRQSRIDRRELMDAGAESDRPAAAVYRGSTPDQRVVHGTLGTLADRVGEAGLTAPTLVIIGEVASLGETLAWVRAGALRRSSGPWLVVASPADTVLLIVGHGAADAPTAADAVTSHAQAIASREIFADVRSGFLRQEPFAKSVLGQIGGRSAVVVPHFATTATSPAKSCRRAGHRGRNRPDQGSRLPPGYPAAAADLVLTEARNAGIDPGGTDIVVVGHGTRRDDRSETSTARLAECVLAETGAASCTAAFLEIDPLIEDWRKFTSRPHVSCSPTCSLRGFTAPKTSPPGSARPASGNCTCVRRWGRRRSWPT